MSDFQGRIVDYSSPAVTNLDNTNLTDSATGKSLFDAARLLTSQYDIDMLDPEDTEFKKEGRPQKRIVRKTSLGMLLNSKESIVSRLDAINQLLEKGAAANSDGQAELARLMTSLIETIKIKGVQAIQSSPGPVQQNFYNAIDSIDISDNPMMDGLARYQTLADIESNKGAVITFVLKTAVDKNKPIIKAGKSYPLSTMMSMAPNEVLDLQDLTIKRASPGFYADVPVEGPAGASSSFNIPPPPPPPPPLSSLTGSDDNIPAALRPYYDNYQDFKSDVNSLSYQIKERTGVKLTGKELNPLLVLNNQAFDPKNSQEVRDQYAIKYDELEKYYVKQAKEKAAKAKAGESQANMLAELQAVLAKRGKGKGKKEKKSRK